MAKVNIKFGTITPLGVALNFNDEVTLSCAISSCEKSTSEYFSHWFIKNPTLLTQGVATLALCYVLHWPFRPHLLCLTYSITEFSTYEKRT